MLMFWSTTLVVRPRVPSPHRSPVFGGPRFDAMVLRVFEITNLCLPAMREAGWGRVITVGSSGVVQPIPNLGMSNALRSALVGWSKTLSF